MCFSSKHKLFTGALLIACSLASAQQTSIKEAPAKPASPPSGKEIFTKYCAVCHGSDGKGGGPAANALKVAPADLTVLSQKNGGNFPSSHVISVLRGEADLPAHRDPAHPNKEMPVWAPAFGATGHDNAEGRKQRIGNLLRYIESLQRK